LIDHLRKSNFQSWTRTITNRRINFWLNIKKCPNV
jgi:hypothetical protein